MNDSCRIVIAEDNPADVMVVRMALQQVMPNFELKVFEDGQRMLQYLDDLAAQAAPCPDIMLLDLNMPKAGGFDVMRHMRDSAACVSVPVIVITSSSRPKDREEALALGAAHYFLKPDDFDDFLKIGDLIRDTLKQQGSRSVDKRKAASRSGGAGH